MINYVAANSIELDETMLKHNFSFLEFFDNEDKKIISSQSGYKYTPYEKLGKNIVDAFISIEDKRFFDHNGIDYLRLIKATINNISTLSYKEGGSTISQQLVKNTLLSNEKTLTRKISEINLTIRLEKKYSKEEIISMYLSAIYFGDGIYGIENASEHYFSKTPTDLSVEEAAVLAGLVKAPSLYSPTKNIEKATSRRNIVLHAMKNCGYISNDEYEKLINCTIQLNISNNHNTNTYISLAESEAEKLLANISDNVYGYKIFTYYDDFDDKLNNINYSKYDGGGIVLGSSGEIIYLHETKQGLLQKRSNVASLIKPLMVYAPCLEENIMTPTSFIDDKKVDFNGYSPSNYKDIYYGKVSIKTAISKSLNTVAVKLYNSLSKQQINKYSSKLGIEITENDGLSVALGATENGITPLEIAKCYSVFQNGGKKQTYSTIKRIEDNNGNIIYEREKSSQKVFSEETSYIITSFLEETAKSGTAKKLNKLNLALYAKTGTNGNKSENKDSYSIAFDRNYIVMAFLTSTDNNIIPSNISGGTIPTDIVSDIFEVIAKDSSPIDPPENVKKIKIDKYLAENKDIILLADECTPNKYVIEEYFDINKAPKEYSTLFINPKVDYAEIIDKDNNIFLQMKTMKIYNYIISNVLTNEKICEIDGKDGTVYIDIGKISEDIQLSITPYVPSGNIGESYYTNTIYKKEMFFE